MRVAFLGLGRMGAPMAAHVAKAGHDLTVWNRTPGKAAEVVALGAREAKTVADAVSGAETVVTMLFGPAAVREVLSAVAEAAPPNALVVECSTTGPAVAREVGEALRALELRKSPSVAETIDWARTLVALGTGTLDEQAIDQTLGVVLKHASDHERAVRELRLRSR